MMANIPSLGKTSSLISNVCNQKYPLYRLGGQVSREYFLIQVGESKLRGKWEKEEKKTTLKYHPSVGWYCARSMRLDLYG